MTEGALDPHQLRLLTKKVRERLHQIVVQNQPVDIETIYMEIEKDAECTPWRKHYWESSKWAVQAEWKHKIRTYLQARDKGKKLYAFDKVKGWSVAKGA